MCEQVRWRAALASCCSCVVVQRCRCSRTVAIPPCCAAVTSCAATTRAAASSCADEPCHGHASSRSCRLATSRHDGLRGACCAFVCLIRAALTTYTCVVLFSPHALVSRCSHHMHLCCAMCSSASTGSWSLSAIRALCARMRRLRPRAAVREPMRMRTREIHRARRCPRRWRLWRGGVLMRGLVCRARWLMSSAAPSSSQWTRSTRALSRPRRLQSIGALRASGVLCLAHCVADFWRRSY